MAAEFAKYRILPPAGYEWLTPVYDLLCALVGLGRGYREWLISLAELASGEAVLDVGSGTGSLAIDVAHSHLDVAVEAVEPSVRALRLAERKAQRCRAHVIFHDAKAESLPFENEKFHCAFCSLALHHIPDRWKLTALTEIGRVLKPSGRLLLADFETTHNWFFWGKYRSQRPLQAWLRSAGFELVFLGKRVGVHVYRATRQTASSGRDGS